MNKLNSEDIGKAIKEARKKIGVRQRDVALACGTGRRFIVDLEKGKPTCQLGKVLMIMGMLDITIELKLPDMV